MFSPGFAEARAVTALDDIQTTTIMFSPGFAEARADTFGTVQVSQGIPSLGGGDTDGFLLWCLAHSYYQNMRSKGLGGDLDEPTGDNAESWGGVFFPL